MDTEAKKRLKWIRLFEEVGDAGLVCRRCGISRPTLRKWLRRWETEGISGLSSQSRRPRFQPTRKRNEQLTKIVARLRTERNLGARRLKNELQREYNVKLSLSTIHKILCDLKVDPLISPKRYQPSMRYEREVPGERVQLDTCKIAPGCYQYTAVDDCSRYRVLAVFARRTAANTVSFLEQVIEEMPFPLQRIQTDRGTEFFAQIVQEWLREHCIKFRPIRPRSPHLNGKVERSQKTDLLEFWALQNHKDPNLAMRLAEWQHHYNWYRIHGALEGKTPMERIHERSQQTPFSDEVEAAYEVSEERYRTQSHLVDQQLARITQTTSSVGTPLPKTLDRSPHNKPPG